jgi:DNA-cytosine methyltransferase
MVKIRNALGLFDGIACGRLALERAGIEFDNYYSSEIDKYAIQIADKNYPDNIRLGDILNWRDWDLEDVDLIMGGSPCQGFSVAGHRLNFDDPRSRLFFDFVDVVKHYKPKYFLLENVRMRKDIQDAISAILGVEPVMINSSLVSAQNRVRLYWTNIPNITQPEDKGIVLKDILEIDGYVDRDKSYCLDANYYKGGNLKSYFEKHRRQLVFSDSGLCHVGTADINTTHESIRRVYHPDGKCPTLTTSMGGHREAKIATSETTWRKLTPLECERLQNLPDGYTEGVSNTRRYKAIGNGWTVDVIAHIFRHMEVTE